MTAPLHSGMSSSVPSGARRGEGLSELSLMAGLQGLPDPVAAADELLAIDADRLAGWFTVARRAADWLRRGADLLADAIPALTAAWSSPTPQASIAALREAGLASRTVIVGQADAADLACSTLTQVKVHVEAELSAAEAAVAALEPTDIGVPRPGGSQGPSPELQHILTELTARMDELRVRATEALQSLALSLRADPRDPIETLPPDRPVTGSGAEPRFPAGGTPTPPPPAGSSPIPIDAKNLERLRLDLQSADDTTREMAQGVMASLTQAEDAGGVAQLLVYESANSWSQGRAAISVGDIGTADNVATLVPGIMSAPARMADGLNDAAALRAEVSRQSPGESTAVVAWYGYDIPLGFASGVSTNPLAKADSTLDVLDDDNALDGGAVLARDIDRFRQWAPAGARFTALGFSMGSTTVSSAAAQGARLDDVVLMGSPGAGAGVATADSYPNLPADHTYVIAFDQDPVTQTRTDLVATSISTLVGGPRISGPDGEPFGVDPALADFGAQVVDATTNVPDVRMSMSLPGPIGILAGPVGSAAFNQWQAVSHHSETNYLSGRSKEAAAAVVLGHYTDVPIKPGR
jgi:Alpha/beta hydrolase